MSTLQNLTTTCTAFSTWTEFASAMNGGYIPTLQTITGRSKAAKARNAAVVELADRLQGLGYNVWRGSK